MPNNTSAFKLVIVIVSIVIIATAGAYFFYKIKGTDEIPPPPLNSSNEGEYVDLVKEALEGNEKLREVREALIAKRYQEAIDISEEVLKTSSSDLDRSVAESSIAVAQFGLKDYQAGVVTYYSVFNNEKYPVTTRAAALSNILQQYRGSLDKKLLQTVLPNVTSLSSEEIHNTIYRKIYDVYPTGISSAWIGRMELTSIDRYNTKAALSIYNEFSQKIDKDIAIQSQGVSSAYIVPNTYMAKARFMYFAYTRFKISSAEEISLTYEKAANLAAARSDFITQQFALLEYVDFLGRQNNVEKAEEVFKVFTSQTIEELVIKNFTAGDIKVNWPGLAYLYTKSKLIKDFADKNGSN